MDTGMEEESLVVYGSKRVIITVTAVVCALLQIIDTTIVNIALPTMQGSLGASLTEITWVITAYAIANVIVMPMTSWLSQQFGRRNYFAVSILIFTFTSWACGNATSIEELIIFRFIQGMGGGALLVTAQTIITESNPEKQMTERVVIKELLNQSSSCPFSRINCNEPIAIISKTIPSQLKS